MIGETLSHFKISEKLGQGGMGVVYRGVDLNLDRPVAIKILAPEAQQDEDSVGRFLREAKTASKLQHPAITTIYEFGVKDDLRYLVMEFVEGKTLRELLGKGPLPIRQLLEIGVQVADALSLADEKGVIHRDIKSENIMLTARGQVKVLDFGLAKMMEKGGPVARDTFQTAAGLVMGTVSYMSPEQALGADLDARTDIYSTGVVLFEMATGALPFTGTSQSVVLAKVLNQAAPSPSGYNAEVPPALESIIARCLEKNRDQRYQTARLLMADLRALEQDWKGRELAPSGRGLRLTPAPVENLQNLVPPAASPSPTAFQTQLASDTRSAAVASPPGAPVASPVVPVARPVAVPGAPPQAAPAAPERARVTPSTRAWRRQASFLVRALSKTFYVAAAVYALGCLALFAMPLFRVERVASLTPVHWLHQGIDPLLAYLTDLINFNLTYRNFNFLLLGLALATYILQQLVTGRLNQLESWIRGPLVGQRAISAHALPQSVAGSSGESSSRMSLLRDYAAAKRILSEVKKEMAFLSIDVAGSTKMKTGEDKIVIEHAFAEYKKFLEGIFREFRVYKVAWTPDGVMSCFFSADDGAGAARKLLKELDWFNRDTHELRTKFSVRCGLNFGEVLVPHGKPLEEISDEVIDVAGHLQKCAETGSLWVSEEVYNRLMDRGGFSRLETQVDNYNVFAWRKPS